MLSSLRALTAGAAKRAIQALHLRDWRSVKSAGGFVRSALLKQPRLEERRDRCIAGLAPFLGPKLERMCSVTGIPMELLGYWAFDAMGSRPPEQVNSTS